MVVWVVTLAKEIHRFSEKLCISHLDLDPELTKSPCNFTSYLDLANKLDLAASMDEFNIRNLKHFSISAVSTPCHRKSAMGHKAQFNSIKI